MFSDSNLTFLPALQGARRGFAFPPVEDPSAISLKDLEERMLVIEAIEKPGNLGDRQQTSRMDRKRVLHGCVLTLAATSGFADRCLK